MALSESDKRYLTADQQSQITALQNQYASAATQADRDRIHQQAEAIRAAAGYSGGSSGSGYEKLAASSGGKTADQLSAWAQDYRAANLSQDGKTWNNGYSTDMNLRSMANEIRQQMDANSKAWHTADPQQQAYLHQQNQQLAELLRQNTGGAESTYNPQTGRWETWSGDFGYGTDLNFTDRQPNIYNSQKNYYGYTDDQMNNWANDKSRYYNFTDTKIRNRDQADEASGYTGQYRNFLLGPYAALLGESAKAHGWDPALYSDVAKDGFYDDVYTAEALNALKRNNDTTDYTKQFTPYALNGVLMPNVMNSANSVANGGNGAYTGVSRGVVDANNPAYIPSYPDVDESAASGQRWDPASYNSYRASFAKGGSGGVNGYEDYLRQMYGAALEGQLAGLESSHLTNMSELDRSSGQVDDTYTEQKRQTTGTSAQQAANWRELANAYGLNSGAIGQAALAQNNQLQSNLNTLESAQAAAQADIERQRTLLGQQYQLQINQAVADNNFELASALYQEAVRQDEALRQQQQFAAQMAMEGAKLAMHAWLRDRHLTLQYDKLAKRR